ncbi:MAG: hypothetical protein WCH46_08045 [bacterium]
MSFTGIIGVNSGGQLCAYSSGSFANGNTWNVQTNAATNLNSVVIASGGGSLLGTDKSTGLLGTITSYSGSWTWYNNSGNIFKIRTVPSSVYSNLGISSPPSGSTVLLANGWYGNNGRLWYGFYGGGAFRAPVSGSN